MAGNRSPPTWGEEIEVAQSWARERDLPLHRWADGSRGRIFAYAVELDDWMYRQVLAGKLQGGESASSQSFGGHSLQPYQVAPEIRLSPPTLPESAPVSSTPTPSAPRTTADPRTNANLLTTADLRSGVGPRSRATRGFLAAATAVFVLVFVVAILHSLTTLSPPSAPAAVTVHPLAPLRTPLPLAVPGPTASHPPLLLRAASARPQRHQPDRQTAELYLEARSSWQSRTPAGLALARSRFADAIRHDPHYAQAYAGLAESYFLSRQYGHMPDRTAFSKAEAAARKAVALDPQSCEAHRSLGFVLSYWTWDMQAAEQEFQRAIALEPTDAEAHHWYATSLMTRGRYPEALAQIDEARRLQPTSSAIQANRGLILLLSGNQERGLDALRQVEASNPAFVMTHIYLADQYLRQHLDDSFLQEEEMTARLQQNRSLARSTHDARRSLERGGQDAMLQTLAHAASQQADHGGSAYHAAAYAMLVGNRQAALRYLKLSHDRHETRFLSVADDSGFAPLQANPEFHALRALADRHS